MSTLPCSHAILYEQGPASPRFLWPVRPAVAVRFAHPATAYLEPLLAGRFAGALPEVVH